MAAILDQADAPAWWDFITKFDATYASFYDNYNALMELGPYIQNSHPELLPQYEAMLQQGAVNADQLNSLKATRDYVYSWLQWMNSSAGNVSSFVTSAAQSTYDWAKRQLGLGEMGFVPVAYAVIGVGAGIAALVVIARWITDAYVFAQRLNALQAEEAKGRTPEQAAAIVNSVMGSPDATSNFLDIPWHSVVTDYLGRVGVDIGAADFANAYRG